MDIRKIKKLIELLEESGIAEIEIKEGEEAVRISRMPTGAAAMHGMHSMPTYAMPMAAQVAAPAQIASAPAAAEAAPPPSVRAKVISYPTLIVISALSYLTAPLSWPPCGLAKSTICQPLTRTKLPSSKRRPLPCCKQKTTRPPQPAHPLLPP